MTALVLVGFILVCSFGEAWGKSFADEMKRTVSIVVGHVSYTLDGAHRLSSEPRGHLSFV